MQFQKPATLERVRHDGDMLRVVANDLLEAQEREEKILVRVYCLVFDRHFLRRHGDVEVVICTSAVLHASRLVWCANGVTEEGQTR